MWLIIYANQIQHQHLLINGFKSVGSKDNVIHGLRHSFRDRLRAVETPLDMVEQLGGWSLKSIGQSYGNGYNIDLMHKYLLKISATIEGLNRLYTECRYIRGL